MTKISCQVCQDLMPMVLDQIASEDSACLVREHTKECPTCKALYRGEAIESFVVNDQKVIWQIKRRLSLVLLLCVVLGGTVGIGVTYEEGMFYNIVIMPVLGALGYYVLEGKWYYVTIGIGMCTYVWCLIRAIIEEAYVYSNFIELLQIPLFMVVCYMVLSCIGVLFVKLFRYALGRG